MLRDKLTESIYQQYLTKIGETIRSQETGRRVKLSKQRFAALFLVEKWSDLRATIETLSDNDLIEFIASQDSKIIEASKIPLKQYFSSLTHSVQSWLFLMTCTDELSRADYDHYTSHGYSDLPVSLKQALIKLFSDKGTFSKIKLNVDDAEFILSQLASNFEILDLVKILQEIDYKSVFQHLPNQLKQSFFSRLMERFETDDLPNLKSLKPLGKQCVHYLFCYGLNNQYLSIKEITDTYNKTPHSDDYFSRDLFFPDAHKEQSISPESALELLIDTKLHPEPEIEALRFFNQHCRNVAATSNSRNTESAPNIDSMLRSKSYLAAPVLATYLLYNYGSTRFSMERLYALLYKISRNPELEPLIDALEPLAAIEESLSYDKSDLNSKIIAATILTRNANILNSSDDADNYLHTLSSIYHAGHYDLVLKECARFIAITELGPISHSVLAFFQSTIQSITKDELSRVPTLFVNAAYIMATRYLMDTGDLVLFADNDVVALCNETFNVVTRQILDARDKDKISRNVTACLGLELTKYVNVPVAGYMPAHTYELETYLIDALQMSGTQILDNQRNKACGKLKLTPNQKRFNDKYLENGTRYIAHRGYGSRNHYLTEKDFGGILPTVLKKIFDHIKDLCHDHVFRSVEVVFFLHNLKFKPSDINYIGDRALGAFDGETFYLIGDLDTDQNAVYNLLKAHKPRFVVTINPEDIHLLTYDRGEEFPHGYLNYRYTKLELTTIEQCDFNAIDVINEGVSELSLTKYANRSPLESIIEKMAPQFEFLGHTFNENGTKYFD
ncbi:hypothetical protein [Vibrio barjaei]|uniref:hypothetical protein n=1 Tax=Vibrio barjaei TaxID=1676683 RepID=UPI0022846054|nr:hypothetical protein [Vibrio barjaei]MCY9870421.1 hypothetical protein [Vibrio barjaei]